MGFLLPTLKSICGATILTCSTIDVGQAPITEGNWYRPAIASSWQWQLSNTVNTSYSVDIYDIDLFDSSTALIQQLHNQNKKVICYFSGGSYEAWRPDKDDFPLSTLGSKLAGWDERWIDIRSPAVRTIMTNRMDLAKQKGCDGVEPDNMDGYTNNPGFPLTADDQLNYNRYIANHAHIRGLSVGLKNDLDQINELVAYYDFSVNEQCFEYSECDLLSPFIAAGKPVFNAEYKSEYVNNASSRQALCTDAANRQFSTLILPLNLDDSFRLACP